MEKIKFENHLASNTENQEVYFMEYIRIIGFLSDNPNVDIVRYKIVDTRSLIFF